ncbi:MAG: hypothetical protein HY698_18150 [Deltaproteobacteria bacterium]|nr:hypothetical protein [Deltaproteobacteria bacterium]
MAHGARLLLGTLILLLPARAWSGADASEEFTGGFRMEGDPKVETVFGDPAEFKKHVDRFFVLHGEMQRARDDFSRNVQAVLSSLAAFRAAGGQKCPLDALALSYSRAFRLGQVYHKLGKELEGHHVSIKELDVLGETKGLTPDYRWKVARALKSYSHVLVDFREMRLAFQDQLASEIAFQGCDPLQLIAKGEELEKSGAPSTTTAVTDDKRLATGKSGKQGGKGREGKKPDLAPPIPSTTATFFVDNSSCPSSVRVYLDGTLLGEVASMSKAAFQTLTARHDLCLIASTSQQQCGVPGTVRKTYIHDGWSITLRCD